MSVYPIVFKPITPASRVRVQGKLYTVKRLRFFHPLFKRYKAIGLFPGNRYSTTISAVLFFAPRKNVSISFSIVENDTNKLVTYLDYLSAFKNYRAIQIRKFGQHFISIITRDITKLLLADGSQLNRFNSSLLTDQGINGLIQFIKNEQPIILQTSTKTKSISFEKFAEQKIIISKEPIPPEKGLVNILYSSIENFRQVAIEYEKKGGLLIARKSTFNK